MIESFLLYTLRRLSAKDLKTLCQLARCDAFNRRTEVTNLCDYISAQLTAAASPGRESLARSLGQERLFAAAFPGREYDNRALRHTMSYLLELTRRYLALDEMESASADFIDILQEPTR